MVFLNIYLHNFILFYLYFLILYMKINEMDPVAGILKMDKILNLEQYLSGFNLLLLLPIGIIGYLVYLLYMPMNRVRTLSDVGFCHSKNDDQRKVSMKEIANEVLRRRKLGNIPPVFPNGWYSLVESRELKLKSVKYVSAIGQNFVVFRGENGEAHILDAYCPHLGANLGLGGTVSGNCIECPFHGWRFNGSDGMCTSIPYSEFVPKFAKVKCWDTREINGSIYVWYHAEEKSPYWEPVEIKGMTSGHWVYRGRTENYASVHIQDIPENGADISHLPQVHNASFLAGSHTQIASKLWSWATHIFTAEWSPGEQSTPHISNIFLTHSLRLLGKCSIFSADVVIQQIGPSIVHLTFHTPFGKGTLIQHLLPLEPMLQKMTHYFYCDPNVPHFYSKMILYTEAIMVERDIAIWNNKMFASNPLLVKEDKSILKYRRWFSQFYSENSPKLTFRRDTLDW